MLREAEAAIAAGEDAADDEVLARAWELVAQAHNLSRLTEYAKALERAAHHARGAGDLRLEASLVTWKAPYFIWGPGHVDEGLRFVGEVIERLGHVPGVQSFALHVRAHMRARLGEFDGALEDVTEYRRCVRELGREREYAVTSGCLWDVCLWSGDWERGAETLREGYEMLERMGSKANLSEIALDLGDAVFRLGMIDEAERLSQIGEEVTAKEDVFGMAQWLNLRARVRAARGDIAGAEALARRAVELPTRTELPEFAAESRLALAEAFRLAGKPEAVPMAAEALELYEQKGNIVAAGRVRAFLDALRG
jgi:tetratricopeptide (TPR) repeat protein